MPRSGQILADRIDVHRQSVGIVVGVVDATGRRVVAYGARAANDTRPLDGDTIFEIGSMTKVFTSLLLADAVERKEVALTDPVAKYLPATVKVPQRGRAITLQDLANHTSGLPRMPSNFAPKDAANPYADYSVEQIYQFLIGYQLARDVGAQYEYSNFGGGLLGHVLARRAGMDYEALVKARITGPLGMRDTRHRADAGDEGASGQRPHASARTDRELGPADARRRGRTSLQRERPADVPLRRHRTSRPRHCPPPCRRMLVTRWPTGQGPMEIALGWHIFKTPGGDIVWHNGGTGGYRTFMGYDPRTRVGVVVLSNTSTRPESDDIGRHLLDASAPLIQNFPPPPASRVEVKVDPAVLRSLRRAVSVRAGRDLHGDAGRQPVPRAAHRPAGVRDLRREREEVLPQGGRRAAHVRDRRAGQGDRGLVLHQNGIDQRAPRIEGEPVTPKAVTLAPEVLDRYTGRYQLTPALVITITRQDARLFAQLTGQPAFEVFASTEREFFFTVVNAQLVFEGESAGRATAVVLHQNGQTPRAPRID